MTKRILYLFSFLLTLAACQKASELSPTGPTTVADDKAFIKGRYNATIDCIKGVRDGEFVQALIKFLDISNNVVGNEVWIEEMTEALELTMGPLELNTDGRFPFAAYRGTYEWNRVTKTFSKVASTSGIFINFPSDPTKLSNNVSLKVTNYTDGLYQANAADIYLPTGVKVSMVKDNVEIANIDGTGVFSSGNFPSPINVVCNVFLKPHNYKVTVTRLATTQFAVKAEMGGDCGSVTDAKITFLNDDYNNFEIEEDLSKVEAVYTKGDFNIKLNWDAKAYYLFSNPTTANLNTTISCDVSQGTEKIGELKFKDVNGERKVFIYYKDGTNEDIAVYNTPFTTELKNILRPFFGNEVDNWF
jgi:hypothetical protein